MKVGSLVVCVKTFEGDWRGKPVYKDKIYTIRYIDKGRSWINGKPFYNGSTIVRLEEIQNHNVPEFGNTEAGYNIERFRELDTPQSISIEEILEEPVYA